MVCGKLEKKSVDETARLEEGVLDRFGRLERKFAEVDEKRMIQEMKISLTELVTKVDKKVTKENAALSKRFTEGIAKLDKKYAQEIADQDTRIEDLGRHMVNNVLDAGQAHHGRERQP